MKHSLKSITELYQETFLTDDTGSIALVAAVLVGSMMKMPPVWLYLIGPSSGGKSALIEAFSKVHFVTQVSDLTPNTFLSGMSASSRETSLLKKLGLNFTIIMKDFTTILQKPEEAQGAIIAQMREIYDGHISKETGNGLTVEWGSKETSKKGHATFIMAATEAIFAAQDKFSDMGTRATNYVLLPQHRKETTKRALRNNNGLAERMENIQNVFAEFIIERTGHGGELLPKELPYVTDEIESQIIDIADFSSICRSVVKRDYRGMKSLALSAEMPARIAKQLLSVAQVLTHINDGVLSDALREIVFKIGLDSIPKQRRIILASLAKYRQANVTGLSEEINYPPERIKEWLDDLHMFGVVTPQKINRALHWRIVPEYRDIMVKYCGVVPVDEDLEGDDAETPGNMTDFGYSGHDTTIEAQDEIKELENEAQKTFEAF